jgi:hypothetical protein
VVHAVVSQEFDVGDLKPSGAGVRAGTIFMRITENTSAPMTFKTRFPPTDCQVRGTDVSTRHTFTTTNHCIACWELTRFRLWYLLKEERRRRTRKEETVTAVNAPIT